MARRRRPALPSRGGAWRCSSSRSPRRKARSPCAASRCTRRSRASSRSPSCARSPRRGHRPRGHRRQARVVPRRSGLPRPRRGALWTGVCSHIEQVQAETTGLSTYHLRIVPTLWLLTQRRNHRIFQHLSIPDIVDKLLAEWGIHPTWRIDRPHHPQARVQGAVRRERLRLPLPPPGGGGHRVHLPRRRTAKGSRSSCRRAAPGRRAAGGAHSPYVDNPNQAAEKEFVTKRRGSRHEVRPGGAHRPRLRLPPQARVRALRRGAEAPPRREDQLRAVPLPARRASSSKGDEGGDTPVADDKGVARATTRSSAHGLAQRAPRSRAARPKRTVAFETNALDLAPGASSRSDNHPHAELGGDAKAPRHRAQHRRGRSGGRVDHRRARRASPTCPTAPLAQDAEARRGPRRAERHRGGPRGQEIHTDEFGRVRVQFPWDREGKNDDRARAGSA